MMNSTETPDKENSKSKQTIPIKTGLKQLCKFSQEKHVLRMVVARSKKSEKEELTQRGMTLLPISPIVSKIKSKKITESSLKCHEAKDREVVEPVPQKITLAPKDETAEIQRHAPQEFLFENDHQEKVFSLSKKKPQKQTVLSISRPKRNRETVPDRQKITINHKLQISPKHRMEPVSKIVSIKEGIKTNTKAKNVDRKSIKPLESKKIAKEKASKPALKEEVIKKVPKSPKTKVINEKVLKKISKMPSKKLLRKKLTKSNNNMCEPHKVSKIPLRIEGALPPKTKKEICSHKSKIPKPIKKTLTKPPKPTPNLQKLSPNEEVVEKQEICLNPTSLTTPNVQELSPNDKTVGKRDVHFNPTSFNTKDIQELTPNEEDVGKRDILFNPSFLTSYELGLEKKDDKVEEILEIKENSETLHETPDNNVVFETKEESELGGENKNDSLKTTEEECDISTNPTRRNILWEPKLNFLNRKLKHETPENTAKKVLKYSEWRKSSRNSPISEVGEVSLGMESQPKWQSTLNTANFLVNSSSTSTANYFMPKSFIMKPNEERNLIVGDLSIDEINAFKVKTDKEKEVNSQLDIPQKDAKKSENDELSDLVKNRDFAKKSPGNKNEIRKSLSMPNNSPMQFIHGLNSQTQINFAKTFAEKCKKLRETELEKPVLILGGDH